MPNQPIKNVILPDEIATVLTEAKGLSVANTSDDLFAAAFPIDEKEAWYDVAFDIPGKGKVTEARVCRVKNGIAANYIEPYMRRRDPDCMRIGDDFPTDKKRYNDTFGAPFNGMRQETLDWLKGEELAVFTFTVGKEMVHVDGIAIAPKNVGFFSLGLGLLQGITDTRTLTAPIKPKCFLFVAPTFRHTHFDGKQIVVHNRTDDAYEIFSYNLYPGPSAKKGIYGALIHFGEKEKWVTAHASAVQVVTPYDNKVTIMHEGASGGGKSEMLEHVHREAEGHLLFAENTITGEKRTIVLPKTCTLHAISDDMTLCHPSIQKNDGRLYITDAEDAWFIRVDHITNYGTDPDIEARSIHPSDKLLFLNIDAKPGATALLWEHIEDAPGKACPNPRFIHPRESDRAIINKPVGVDIRSFGVRTPPCTKDAPSYGIMGLFHVLPPALAWLWRLVSPRGFANPSIVDKGGMSSEGVGSYWPFATGRKVDQANLLLTQIKCTPNVHYVLCPNQHIGAWKVRFMAQWLMREYLARRGGAWFYQSDITPSRCELLGYALRKVIVEGQDIEEEFLQVEKQPNVGDEAYDKGADELRTFFKQQLEQYNTEGLDPLGRKIISCAMDGGTVADYDALIKGESFVVSD